MHCTRDILQSIILLNILYFYYKIVKPLTIRFFINDAEHN